MSFLNKAASSDPCFYSIFTLYCAKTSYGKVDNGFLEAVIIVWIENVCKNATWV